MQDRLLDIVLAMPPYHAVRPRPEEEICAAVHRVRDACRLEVGCIRWAEWLAATRRVEARFTGLVAGAEVVVLVTEGLLDPRTKKSGDWMAGNYIMSGALPAAAELLLLDIQAPDSDAVALLRSVAGRRAAFGVFDDAAYGGVQKARMLDKLRGWWGDATAGTAPAAAAMKVHVMLPWATQRALDTIARSGGGSGADGRFAVGVVHDSVMPPPPPGSFSIPSHTFLEHKVPDDKSFPAAAARVLDRELGIVPPYKAADAAWRRVPPACATG